jgi:hypothetical protein
MDEFNVWISQEKYTIIARDKFHLSSILFILCRQMTIPHKNGLKQ